MADIAISVVAKLIEVIGSETIKEICRMWGYKDELQELNKTIITINNVLLDADSKRDLSMVQQGYISELKDAVYDADDLFDEFRTLAELKLIKGSKRGKFFGKVCEFFSSNKGKLGQAYRMSKKVKQIKEVLDAIASNYKNFGFNVDFKPIVRRREETCSYVVAKDIIGRDKDKDVIIDMLMDPSGDDEGFRFLTIVGVGGLGKTALAQLVFNDEKIKNEFSSSKFSSSRFWVCVSDQDGEQFDVRTILLKILEVVTEKTLDNSSSMELVKNQFQKEFTERKYLLVLDDVWNEDRDNWVKLKTFLMMGERGSKIVVTSRSEKTSSIIGSEHVHKLKGLSEEDSQCLFEMSAFNVGEMHPELVNMGVNIARKCCGVPLAIKVVGSLLYGQDKSKWESIERSGLIDISDGNNNNNKILSILKLSYFNLLPSLKSCFSYCAIFSKDFQMDKVMLIGLWIAQGYIIPLDGGQSVEDAAEEYFSILMRRCFFQDIKRDKYNNVISVKIHDLMHDVAEEVGKEEICGVSSNRNKLGKKVRHVNADNECVEISVCRSKIRSYICDSSKEHSLNKQVEELTALRVLDFPNVSIEILPKIIDRLLLLRYLNLSGNKCLEVLPDSITRLYNLQTLLLRHCKNLREVPKDFSNLINLRHLDLYGCNKLNDMPLGILKLRKLKVIPYFLASSEISDEEFKVLQQVFTKLNGQIEIKRVHNKVDNIGIGGLDIMKPLVKLIFDWDKGEWVIPEDVLVKLELPTYLNELGLFNYNGKTIPWSTISLLHHLICIKITYCSNLKQVPVLSKCPKLKTLELGMLDSVEYMEDGMSGEDTEFFPSLETLEIIRMEKLKGWWKRDIPEMKLRFPRLISLKIEQCSSLAINVVCPPTLKKLELEENSERLVLTGELGNLKEMVVEKVDHLKLLSPTNNCLTSLKLTGEIEVESALEHAQSWASSLQTLEICDCENLKRLPRLDHLIALRKLKFRGNHELSICEEEEEEDEDPWKCLPQSLRYLLFDRLPKMKSLPKGLQHLTSLLSLNLSHLDNMEGGIPEWINCLSSLVSLKIRDCKSIKSLPEAIKDLSSLIRLDLRGCPDLQERWKNPNGEDFPKIQHILHIRTDRHQ